MTSQLIDLHPSLSGLWQELQETDLASLECWKDISLAMQFSAVPGLQRLGSELYNSLRRDTGDKLFRPGSELTAIATQINQAIGAAFQGVPFPASALVAINSLRVNTQQNLFSANQWADDITENPIVELTTSDRERLRVWLAKAAKLFKVAMLQLIKGQPDGLAALQKLLSRLAVVTKNCASFPLWSSAERFVNQLDVTTSKLALPQILMRHVLQNLTAISKSETPETETGQTSVLARQLSVYSASYHEHKSWLVMSPDVQFDRAQKALHALQTALLDFFEDGSEFEILTSVPERATDLASELSNAGLNACSIYAQTLAEYVAQQVLSRKLLPSAERIDQLTRVVIAIEWALKLAAWHLPWQEALNAADRSHQQLQQSLDEGISSTDQQVSDGADTKEEVVNDIDPELRDIFVEEAREVLQDMSQALAKGSLIETDLQDIRRGFHTIKGSGRMVGANAIGEFGWNLENTYNQILQGSHTLTIDHVSLVSAAVDVLFEMVDALESGQGDALTPRAEKINSLLVQQTNHSSPALQDWQEAFADEPLEQDPFYQQAQALLETIANFVDQASVNGAGVNVPNDVLHAIHALKSGAKNAKLDSLIALISPLESKLKLAHKLDAEALELLSQTVKMATLCLMNEQDQQSLEQLQARIEAWDIAQNEAVESAIATLLAVGDTLDTMYPALLSYDLSFDWHTCAEQLQHETQPLLEAQPSLASLLNGIADFILRHVVDKQVLSHLEPALSQAFDALNLIAADQSPVIDAAILHKLADQLESADQDLEDSEQNVESPLARSFTEEIPAPLLEPREEPVQDIAAEETPPGKSETTQLDEDVDQELIEIFSEEAQELIEAIDLALIDWQQSPDDKRPVEALKRYLHTLKGGARMVSWREMAAAAHDFESEIIAAQTQPDEANFKHWRSQWQLLVDQLQSNVIKEDESTAVAAVATNNQQVPKAIDLLKVPVDALEEMANIGGEISINRAQLDEQRVSMLKVLNELESAQLRTTDQLRRLDSQTQAQIAYRREQLDTASEEAFDPLEMDRYTQLQQLTNGLMESLSDIGDLKSSADELMRNMETTLVQQGRMSASLVQKLHQSRMIPVARLMPRLRRLVDQISLELNKPIEFLAEQIEGELQRSVLERIATSLEHIVRNALDHGIESPAKRKALGKPEMGVIKLSVQRRDNELVFVMSDDGAGIDPEVVRAKAEHRGMISSGDELTPNEIIRLIMKPGFSTSETVSEISGRGVGMDVVDSEILSLGGRVEIQSVVDRGTEFTLVVPFSQSVNRALMVAISDQSFAIPFAGIEGIMRISRRELDDLRVNDEGRLSYGKQHYQFCELSQLLGIEAVDSASQEGYSPLILVRTADGNFAVRVDSLRGSRELVVKSLGPQFGKLVGISGATIMGDGSVLSILDLPPLLRAWQQGLRFALPTQLQGEGPEQHGTVMIVDDSITVRKITSKLLQRHQYAVLTAKDGVDGLEKLELQKPDIILLDVEMPRMDGFEFASQVRHSEAWQHIPIVMVSSRSGDKHRRRATEVGVDHLLSKPYREEVLLQMIEGLLKHGRNGVLDHG